MRKNLPDLLVEPLQPSDFALNLQHEYYYIVPSDWASATRPSATL
jgi:hypothetical protein